MLTRLLLVRHGESVANRQGIFAGYHDAELEDKGKTQAYKTAEYIVSKYQVDKVYASDLRRAYETGKAVADLAGVPIVSKEGLREIFGGKWEGVPFAELPISYPKEYEVWMNNIGKSRCPDGESIEEVGRRVLKTLTDIACDNEGKTIVIATHASPIRSLESLLRTGGTEKMQTIPWVSNASVTELFYEDGKWEYGQIGYDAHLDELKTVLPEDI